MSVAYDAVTRSHASGSTSASEASFSWTHTPVGTPKGVLVFTFSNTTNDNATSVTYGGTSMTAVSGGRAVQSGTYGGEVKAWFLGSSISTGNQTVVVNRTNNADTMWAAAYTVTAAANTEVHTAGIVLIQSTGGTSEQSITDGQSSGSNNSVRFAAVNCNGDNVQTFFTTIVFDGTVMEGASSTIETNAYNDLTNQVFVTAYETTAGIGSRNVGFQYNPLTVFMVTPHTAAVHLAVKESAGGGGGGTTNPAMLLAMMIAQEARNERITYGGGRENTGFI